MSRDSPSDKETYTTYRSTVATGITSEQKSPFCTPLITIHLHQLFVISRGRCTSSLSQYRRLQIPLIYSSESASSVELPLHFKVRERVIPGVTGVILSIRRVFILEPASAPSSCSPEASAWRVALGPRPKTRRCPTEGSGTRSLEWLLQQPALKTSQGHYSPNSFLA